MKHLIFLFQGSEVTTGSNI